MTRWSYLEIKKRMRINFDTDNAPYIMCTLARATIQREREEGVARSAVPLSTFHMSGSQSVRTCTYGMRAPARTCAHAPYNRARDRKFLGHYIQDVKKCIKNTWRATE